MERVVRELRHTARALLASPGLAVIAALSLGLGIGANVTFFA